MKLKLGLLCSAIILLSACKDNNIEIKQFTGYAQKGPFINGSSVSINDLDSTLNQTGKSYSTTIADNSGRYEQLDMTLASSYVKLKVDGYYYNEVMGQVSESPLTLYALANVKDATTMNVNILTHLERERMEYLIKQKGMNFTEAKEQAKNEVLKIFGFENISTGNSEDMNIYNNGEGDGVLLAMSIILQGFRNTSELSELLADIITDIKTDGELSPELGSKLIDDARLINLDNINGSPLITFPAVITNLNERYHELTNPEFALLIPDFAKYVNSFIKNTSYVPTKHIEFNKQHAYSASILSDSCTVIDTKYTMKAYRLEASLPKGTCVKIEFSPAGSNSSPIVVNAHDSATELSIPLYFDPGMSPITFKVYENIHSILSNTPTMTKTLIVK